MRVKTNQTKGFVDAFIEIPNSKLDVVNCLVPQSYGVSLPRLQETNLWETYCMLMPRPRHESEQKYKTLQRASLA